MLRCSSARAGPGAVRSRSSGQHTSCTLVAPQRRCSWASSASRQARRPLPPVHAQASPAGAAESKGFTPQTPAHLDEPTERLLRWASQHDLSSLDISQLAQLGADVAAADPATGQSALHRAAARGNAEAVGALVLAGANPNAADQEGKTPLHYAAEAVAGHRGGSARMAGMAVTGLLDMGANLDAADSQGETPRSILLRHVQAEVGVPLEKLLGS